MSTMRDTIPYKVRPLGIVLLHLQHSDLPDLYTYSIHETSLTNVFPVW